MTDLTQSERLIVYRRREGLTQKQMAKKLGMSLRAYRACEVSSQPCDFDPEMEFVKTHEMCYLLRIRKRWSLEAGAKRVGVSRWWLRRMERGDAPVARLKSFWGIS